MDYTIQGKLTPMVEISLDEGESIYTQAGSLMYKTRSVDMDVYGGKEIVSDVIKRLLTKESLMFVRFTGPGTVGISPYFPGQIIEVDLQEGESIHVNRGAFLLAESSVSFDIDWIAGSIGSRIKLGLLGGEGFFFQRITGPGKVFLYVCGDIVRGELEEDQVVDIEQGALVYKDVNVDYDLVRVHGIDKILFSGAGLFLGRLKGPGRIALQTMDLGRFVGRIISPLRR